MKQMPPKRRRWLLKMRAVSQRITWFLGTRYPETFPFVFVVGHPKSGTVWASQLVADYLQIPFPRYSYLPIGFPAVVHGHHGVRRDYPRAVYVVRDPRDVMVSWYFHSARLSGRWHRERAPKYTKNGAADAGEAIIDLLPAYIEDHMQRGGAFKPKLNWAEHVRTYLQNKHDRVALLRFEQLLADGPGHLAQAIEVLTGESVDMERVRETIDRFSFQRQAKRKPGTEDRSSFLRKGKAGDWREHFTREAAEILDRYCGEVMMELGYAEDRSWVETCPPREQMQEQREQVAAVT